MLTLDWSRHTRALCAGPDVIDHNQWHDATRASPIVLRADFIQSDLCRLVCYASNLGSCWSWP